VLAQLSGFEVGFKRPEMDRRSQIFTISPMVRSRKT
jgi:hypothetical protein